MKNVKFNRGNLGRGKWNKVKAGVIAGAMAY